MATDWSGFAHLEHRQTGKAAEPTGKAKAKPKGTNANALTKAIIDYMALKGWKAWRNNNGAVFDPTTQAFRKNNNALLGVPDILGYCRKSGRFASIEVKAGKDKLSPHQVHFLNEVTQAGGFAFEARKLDAFIAAFDEFELKQKKP